MAAVASKLGRTFLAAVASKLGRAGTEVFPTANVGVLGVGVAVLVTFTGWFVRKSRSMHFWQAFQSQEEHLCLPWVRFGVRQTLHLKRDISR